MKETEKNLLRFVAEGDIRKAQQAARIFAESVKTKSDEKFTKAIIEKLNKKESQFIELPANLKDILSAESCEDFPVDRFLLRDGEAKIVQDVLNASSASEILKNRGIHYYPALLLYGDSGCGKTMLARYIAHITNLPFVYVRFSGLVDSYLGRTQANIARVFDYAKKAPCVLCFDEIDAVGMARGQKNDVGEMNRIVIALMQELDVCPNGTILVATTNRKDRLDDALIRRFPLSFCVPPLSADDAAKLAKSFLATADPDNLFDHDRWITEYVVRSLDSADTKSVPAFKVINKCTQIVVDTTIGGLQNATK